MKSIGLWFFLKKKAKLFHLLERITKKPTKISITIGNKLSWVIVIGSSLGKASILFPHTGLSCLSPFP